MGSFAYVTPWECDHVIYRPHQLIAFDSSRCNYSYFHWVTNAVTNAVTNTAERDTQADWMSNTKQLKDAGNKATSDTTNQR